MVEVNAGYGVLHYTTLKPDVLNILVTNFRVTSNIISTNMSLPQVFASSSTALSARTPDVALTATNSFPHSSYATDSN